MGPDANTITAIAAIVAAIAAIITSCIVFWQVRQEGRLTRYSVGIETLLRFQTDWDDLATTRARAAAEIQAGNCAGRHVIEVIDFFDSIGMLTKKGVLDNELVWHTFYWPMANYWSVCQDFVRKTQNDEGSATWEDFGDLMSEMKLMESKRSNRPLAAIGPSKEQVVEFMADEKACLKGT